MPVGNSKLYIFLKFFTGDYSVFVVAFKRKRIIRLRSLKLYFSNTRKIFLSSCNDLHKNSYLILLILHTGFGLYALSISPLSPFFQRSYISRTIELWIFSGSTFLITSMPRKQSFICEYNLTP